MTQSVSQSESVHNLRLQDLSMSLWLWLWLWLCFSSFSFRLHCIHFLSLPSTFLFFLFLSFAGIRSCPPVHRVRSGFSFCFCFSGGLLWPLHRQSILFPTRLTIACVAFNKSVFLSFFFSFLFWLCPKRPLGSHFTDSRLAASPTQSVSQRSTDTTN